MTQEQELLKEALYALNMIPNHKDVCMDGSSSYDLASKIDKFIKPFMRDQEYLNNPDQLVYVTWVDGEETRKYTYRTILALARNNSAYARSLIDRKNRGSIEQMIFDDIFDGKVIPFQGTYKILK